MEEYKTESNEESYILSYKPEYMIMLIPQYLKCNSMDLLSHYEKINKKYCGEDYENQKENIFSVNNIFLEESLKDIYEIKKDLFLKENIEYFVKDLYDNSNLKFIVEEIKLEKFDDLSLNYKCFGFNRKSDLEKSLEKISLEKNYEKFDEDNDFVFLTKLKWL